MSSITKTVLGLVLTKPKCHVHHICVSFMRYKHKKETNPLMFQQMLILNFYHTEVEACTF